jgi:phosphosulfolactate synthase (CoM biosynthesis protein A)
MDEGRAFDFIRRNVREPKPRARGQTEIRGPYYTPVGRRYLEDLFESAGAYIDAFKFAGGSFSVLPRRVLHELIELCHRNQVLVSTGGWIEYVLTQGPMAVDRYIGQCRDLGFDILEISSGFIAIPEADLLRLTEKVRRAELTPKPEVGIQFGAGGATSAEALAEEGTRDVGSAIALARRYLAAGATTIMIESEGITESVHAWRIDAIARIAEEVGIERVMFEAADPAVFAWYVKTYGPAVNLFVDHTQIIQLECLREGIWGTKDTWGRVVSYTGSVGERS